MVDIHIQPHADSVGGDQIVHLAGLVHGHLGVSRARAQRPHYHRRAATLAAHQFGQHVNVLDRERDHRATPRQATDFGRPGIGQTRKTRPGDNRRVGDQPVNQAANGGGTQEHGLDFAAGMQQAIGEDMTALGVGSQLDFIDRQKFHVVVERHRLDGANEIAGVRWKDFFLAGDQCHGRAALLGDHSVIVLARQKAQWKTNHAAGVAQHALDRQIRFAGVGRPKHGRHAGLCSAHCHSSRSNARRAEGQGPR